MRILRGEYSVPPGGKIYLIIGRRLRGVDGRRRRPVLGSDQARGRLADRSNDRCAAGPPPVSVSTWLAGRARSRPARTQTPWRAIGETEKRVEALIEILGGVFEGIFEWRRDRAERGGAMKQPGAYPRGGGDERPQGGGQGLGGGPSSRRATRQ